RAMAYLPPQTQAMLIAHYIDEQPQTEIAERMGMKTGTLAVSLHRGKLALRHVLEHELRDDAAALGLATPDGKSWDETRIWCFICGKRRMLGQFDVAQGHLKLRCPVCSDQPFLDHRAAISGIKTYGAALNRVIKWIDDFFPAVLAAREAMCLGCGKMAP